MQLLHATLLPTLEPVTQKSLGIYLTKKADNTGLHKKCSLHENNNFCSIFVHFIPLHLITSSLLRYRAVIVKQRQFGMLMHVSPRHGMLSTRRKHFHSVISFIVFMGGVFTKSRLNALCNNIHLPRRFPPVHFYMHISSPSLTKKRKKKPAFVKFTEK